MTYNVSSGRLNPTTPTPCFHLTDSNDKQETKEKQGNKHANKYANICSLNKYDILRSHVK